MIGEDAAEGASQPATGFPSKKRINVDAKLPTFNWAPIPYHRIAQTVFKDINDESLYEVSLSPVLVGESDCKMHSPYNPDFSL